MSYTRKLVLIALAASLLASGLAGWKWTGKSIAPEPAKATPTSLTPDGWSWGGDSGE